MSAEIHAKIAEKVYPDEEVWIDTKHCIWRDPCCCHRKGSDRGLGKYFDLLEVDKVTGEPNCQAKASALDVLVYLLKRIDLYGCAQLLEEIRDADNPCAAIYEAAREVIENER